MTDDLENVQSPTLQQKIEALLIVAESPVSVMSLAVALDETTGSVQDAIKLLRSDYDGDYDGEGGGVRRGFELREIAGGYRFYVREELDQVVANFVHEETTQRLSQAALETLAVIAYRQPITRGAIASIRAVNVDSVVRTLVNRGLVSEVGADAETGAILYGTSEELLEHLGLQSISDLPPISPLLDGGEKGFDVEY